MCRQYTFRKFLMPSFEACLPDVTKEFKLLSDITNLQARIQPPQNKCCLSVIPFMVTPGKTLISCQPLLTGLKVNNQLVAYATRFLAVRLKNHVWLHHRALKAKVQCDFSAYSPGHTNILQLININLNIDITQPGTKYM